MQKYNKAWIALGAALVVLGSALSDGHVSTTEAVQTLAAFAGSYGVFRVSNAK